MEPTKAQRNGGHLGSPPRIGGMIAALLIAACHALPESPPPPGDLALPGEAVPSPQPVDIASRSFDIPSGPVTLHGTLTRKDEGMVGIDFELIVREVNPSANHLQGVEYSLSYTVAATDSRTIELRAGDRRMYAVSPMDGGSWEDVLLAGDAARSLHFVRLEGAAEERDPAGR